MAIKDKWAKLSVWQKRLTTVAAIIAAIIAIATPVWGGVSYLATDAEVDAKIKVVQKSFDEYATEQTVREKRKAIQDAQWRLEDINYRLLDPNLPAVQQAALVQAKNKAEAQIRCIQEGLEFC